MNPAVVLCECGHEDEDHGADTCIYCPCEWFKAETISPGIEAEQAS
jgi:hypothetical protein